MNGTRKTLQVDTMSPISNHNVTILSPINPKRSPAHPKITLSPVARSQEERSFFLKHIGNMSDSQLRKYRKWFNSMTKRHSGIDINDLAMVLLSGGVMKNKKDVISLFKGLDSDGTGDVSFEEFIISLSSDFAARKLRMDKLNTLVDDSYMSAPDSVLSHKRSSVLKTKHVEGNAIVRSHEVGKFISQTAYKRKGSRASHLGVVSGHPLNQNLECVIHTHNKHLKRVLEAVCQVDPHLNDTSRFPRSSSDSPRKEEQMLASNITTDIPAILPQIESPRNIEDVGADVVKNHSNGDVVDDEKPAPRLSYSYSIPFPSIPPLCPPEPSPPFAFPHQINISLPKKGMVTPGDLLVSPFPTKDATFYRVQQQRLLQRRREIMLLRR